MKVMIVAALIFGGQFAAAEAMDAASWQRKALKAVKAENSVEDARWRMPETNVLWVSAKPDGSNRDGFAEYLCMVLNDAGAPEGELKTVWILDPATFENGGKPMGMTACR